MAPSQSVMERCDECGYDYAAIERDLIPGALRAHAKTYGERLADLDDEVRRAHPFDGMWSILEYVCHMRDVLRVQKERTERALAEDEPHFPQMRRDERVTEERYNEQDPALVTTELAEAADAYAEVLEGLDTAGWERTGVYNYPTKQSRTVEWIGRHTIHECVHHLIDLERLRNAGPRQH